jgi:hypothetical protein
MTVAAKVRVLLDRAVFSDVRIGEAGHQGLGKREDAQLRIKSSLQVLSRGVSMTAWMFLFVGPGRDL